MTTWGVEDLVIRYGRTTAVAGLSLELPAGTITAMVGGDGAGKTSALRALAGAVAPSEGRLSRPPPHEIGYMSAGPGIYHDLTVRENLSFAGRAYGVSAGSIRDRARLLLERSGLSDVPDRLAGNLSGGMRQKLALAVAMIHEPKLLVLDEPTTGVDPVSRAELWRLIARAAAANATVLIATSYVDEAERAEQLVALADGVTLLQGAPTDIVASLPGTLFSSPTKPHARFTWRRGATWRTWLAEGAAPRGATRVEPDLEDAVVVAELTQGLRAPKEVVAA